VLAGDGRCDSPGSSDKFCTYSLMDTATNKILHAETIDKREVQLHHLIWSEKEFYMH